MTIKTRFCTMKSYLGFDEFWVFFAHFCQRMILSSCCAQYPLFLFRIQRVCFSLMIQLQNDNINKNVEKIYKFQRKKYTKVLTEARSSSSTLCNKKNKTVIREGNKRMLSMSTAIWNMHN